MNINKHPCFNPGACKDFARVHLPVAPRCNIQCNFCNRKFDCVNESRPGVSSTLLKPFQAMNYLEDVMAFHPNTSVVGIAGPGDPFANPEQTLTTLEMVKEKYPEMLLCVASNGLGLPDWLKELKQLEVSHVSITVNAVDPAIGEKIYAWVRYGKRSLPPAEGARILMDRQMESIKGLKALGIIVKVNAIVLPGINDHHIGDIAEKMAALNVDLLNCMPYFPNAGSNFSHISEPDPDLMSKVRQTAEGFVPQMHHCTRCRADAVGRLGDEPNLELMQRMLDHASDPEPSPVDPEPDTAGKGLLLPSRVAVATHEGMLVNQHLGEAAQLQIYDIDDDEPVHVDNRPTPEPGSQDLRWLALADSIKDCQMLLVSGIGEVPRNILSKKGIDILEVNGMIHEVIHAVKNNENINHLIAREQKICSRSCQGSGTGCM
ncbi:MAG: nitrogenase cofactor biosynthesis protein NifB [Desulfobacteraceae bacterium]|nr:MAG: nitrogenase cofactor biosynthesis protein NifB [Desulfobacteraceae bacterium]